MEQDTSITCPKCKRVVNNVIAELRYEDIKATTFLHRCICGSFIGNFVYDNADKNTEYIIKDITPNAN